jgi:hypothetical protein
MRVSLCDSFSASEVLAKKAKDTKYVTALIFIVALIVKFLIFYDG